MPFRLSRIFIVLLPAIAGLAFATVLICARSKMNSSNAPADNSNFPTSTAVQAPLSPAIPDAVSPQLQAISASSHYVHFEISELEKDRLSILIETGTSVDNFAHHSPTHENLRGYLLTIDLNNLSESRRIIGPLYDLRGAISAMTNETGLTFNDKDVSDLSQKPIMFFTRSGELRNLHFDDALDQQTQWVLMSDDATPTWKKVGSWKKVPKSKQSSRFSIGSTSGRYLVQQELDDRVRVYDLLEGKRLEDDWLEGAFVELLSRQDLKDSFRNLTSDLNFLVAIPDRSDFQIGDKTYSWATHGLFYSRPNPSPQVFSSIAPEIGRMTPFSINDRLLIVNDIEIIDKMKNVLELKNVEGETEYSHEVDERYTWIRNYSTETYCDSELRRITFLRIPGYLLDFCILPNQVNLRIWFS